MLSNIRKWHISLKQSILFRSELHFNAIFNVKSSASVNIYKEQMMTNIYLSGLYITEMKDIYTGFFLHTFKNAAEDILCIFFEV